MSTIIKRAQKAPLELKVYNDSQTTYYSLLDSYGAMAAIARTDYLLMPDAERTERIGKIVEYLQTVEEIQGMEVVTLEEAEECANTASLPGPQVACKCFYSTIGFDVAIKRGDAYEWQSITVGSYHSNILLFKSHVDLRYGEVLEYTFTTGARDTSLSEYNIPFFVVDGKAVVPEKVGGQYVCKFKLVVSKQLHAVHICMQLQFRLCDLNMNTANPRDIVFEYKPVGAGRRPIAATLAYNGGWTYAYIPSETNIPVSGVYTLPGSFTHFKTLYSGYSDPYASCIYRIITKEGNTANINVNTLRFSIINNSSYTGGIVAQLYYAEEGGYPNNTLNFNLEQGRNDWTVENVSSYYVFVKITVRGTSVRLSHKSMNMWGEGNYALGDNSGYMYTQNAGTETVFWTCSNTSYQEGELVSFLPTTIAIVDS